MFMATCCSNATSKRPPSKGKLQRIGDLKRHLPALSRALCQIARGIHEWLAEVDARDPAAIGRSEKARRPTDAGADIEDRHAGSDPDQRGKLGGRGKPAGVKLVESAQLLGRELLIRRPEDSERGLQPLGQASRAIVIAHAIKSIGHCTVPLKLQVVAAVSTSALPDFQVRRTTTSRARLFAIMSTGYEAELHSQAGGAGRCRDVSCGGEAAQLSPRG